MAAGEAFGPDQRERIERARRAVEEQAGVSFSIRVGELDAPPRLEAERLLANIADSSRASAVLVLIAPGERRVEIMTTPAVRRRISDHAAGLAVLAMTSSFAVGDLVGGLVNGLRQLADAAGTRPAGERSAMADPARARSALVSGADQVEIKRPTEVDNELESSSPIGRRAT